jgi:glutamate decarboxylase
LILLLQQQILENSVNTTSPGFMDKLYSSPSPPGLAADMLLSILNTNSHVYTVSPALTVVEKYTGKRLAYEFGLRESVSGGVTCPGGAQSNATAMLVARNIRFPQVVTDGVASLSKSLAVFTSSASHYSMVSAAQNLGLGGKSVRKVATINDAMDPEALDKEMQKAVDEGHIPFYVGATAGTTVRGAYDDLRAIAAVAKKYGAWLHVDACWGGGAIFSSTHKHKLDGSELADTIAINPHKMLGVPLTCSFLLGRDLRTFVVANRLEAGYLFHGDAELAQSDGSTTKGQAQPNGVGEEDEDWRNSARILNAPHPDKVTDMAQFTTQCGRRPDAIKLYAHWRYYGTDGIGKHIDIAFQGAKTVLDLVRQSTTLSAVETGDPPCAQACFYYSGTKGNLGPEKRITREIVERLVDYGWMTDFAPGKTKQEEYLRVVCNRLSTDEVVGNLVKAVEIVGRQVEKEWNL